MDSVSYKKTVAVAALPTPSSELNGVMVRLASDDKPYWCNGSQWVDMTAPGAGGSVSGTQTSLDFGATPMYSKSFQVADASATPGDKYLITASPNGDEYEMDGILCHGFCSSSGFITVYAHAIPGPIVGTKSIVYIKV
jgi:hypothetical protein